MAGTYYSAQPVLPFIGATKGDDGAFTLSPVTLTATNTDNRSEIDVDGMQQVILSIRYITGSGGSNKVLHLLIDFSPDGTNYYQEATEEASTTTITEYQAERIFTGAVASTTYSLRIAIPVADVQKIRIAFHETNQTNFGTLSVLSTTSGQ